jgi:hypothetical protein
MRPAQQCRSVAGLCPGLVRHGGFPEGRRLAPRPLGCWHSARPRRWGREKASGNALLRRLAGQHGASPAPSYRVASTNRRPGGARMISSSSCRSASGPSSCTSSIPSTPGRAAPPEPTADPTTYATFQIIAPGQAPSPVCRLFTFYSSLVSPG